MSASHKIAFLEKSLSKCTPYYAALPHDVTYTQAGEHQREGLEHVKDLFRRDIRILKEELLDRDATIAPLKQRLASALSAASAPATAPPPLPSSDPNEATSSGRFPLPSLQTFFACLFPSPPSLSARLAHQQANADASNATGDRPSCSPTSTPRSPGPTEAEWAPSVHEYIGHALDKPCDAHTSSLKMHTAQVLTQLVCAGLLGSNSDPLDISALMSATSHRALLMASDLAESCLTQLLYAACTHMRKGRHLDHDAWAREDGHLRKQWARVVKESEQLETTKRDLHAQILAAHKLTKHVHDKSLRCQDGMQASSSCRFAGSVVTPPGCCAQRMPVGTNDALITSLIDEEMTRSERTPHPLPFHECQQYIHWLTTVQGLSAALLDKSEGLAKSLSQSTPLSQDCSHLAPRHNPLNHQNLDILHIWIT
eukprot:gene5350-955_t